MAIVLLLVIVAVVVYRATTPEEHERMLDAARRSIVRSQHELVRRAPEDLAFREALRARSRRPVVTLALATASAAVFMGMVVERGAVGDSETLMRWGASLGSRTTNGEWWRLVASMFVQPGLLIFLVNFVALVQVGFMLERLIGRAAFVVLYLAAGVVASLSDVSVQPVTVNAGASGAIFGLYGALAGAWACGIVGRSGMPIPLATLKRLVPVALLFAIGSLATGSVATSSELAGCLTGCVCGIALTAGAAAGATRRGAFAFAVVAGFALVWGFTLRGITDVQPEIARVVALEERTASNYETALARFKGGRLPIANLIEIIERAIVPELKAEQARIDGLRRVPSEHQPVVHDAAEYLRHRTESWQLRADGLRKMSGRTSQAESRPDANAATRVQVQARYAANIQVMGKAETQERAALDALEQVKLFTSKSAAAAGPAVGDK
jgi:rhomboid protease GluP